MNKFLRFRATNKFSKYFIFGFFLDFIEAKQFLQKLYS